jgi:PAS domain S-box-containing protein
MRNAAGRIATVLLLAASILGFGNAAAETSPGKDSASERPLIIAISGGYSPFSVTAPNGEHTGLLVEMWRLWSEATGTPIRFRASDWAGTIEAVRNGNADIHFGLFRNEERARWMDFSDPIHEIRTAVYFRAGRRDPVPLSELAGSRVGVMRGSHQSKFLKETYPDLTVVDLKNGEAVMLALLADDVDAIVHEVPSANIELAGIGLYGAVVTSDESLPTDFVHAGVAKGREDLIVRIDEGFRAIPPKRLAELEQRWIPQEEDHFYHGADGKIRLTASEEAWLDSHPVIRFAVTNFITPVDIVGEGGEYSGLNADLITLLNRKLGSNIVPEFHSSWGDLVERTMTGKVDGAFSLSRTPERMQHILFTRPYAFDPVIAVVRRDDKDIATWEDLAGKTASVVRGASMIEDVRAALGAGTLIEVEDETAGLKQLADGKADAHVSWLMPFGNAQKKDPVSGLRIAVTRNTESGSLRIGIHKSRRKLHSIIRKVFNTIPREELTEVRNRWLYAEKRDTTAAAIGLTLDEKAWIKAHPLVSVTALSDWSPFESRGEDGAYAGISADFVRIVGERTGLKTVPVFDTWAAHLDGLRRGEMDLAPGIYRTAEREEYLEFTRPFVEMYDVIVTQTHRTDIMSMADLDGKTVAVENGYGMHELLKAEHPNTRLLVVESTLDALKAVALGEADAYVGSQVVTAHLIETNLLQNVKIAAFADRDPTFLAMAVPKDRPILRDIVDKALASIGADERKAIIGGHVSLGRAAPTRRLALTDEERAWLKAHPKIRVHNEMDWPPFNFNVNGQSKGFSIAYMNLLADRLGIEIEYLSGKTWGEFVDMIRNKDLDVMLNIIQTEDREKFILFTDPYVENPPVIVARQGDGTIRKFADLSGKRVAIPRGFFYQELIERNFPQIDLYLVEDQTDALEAVAFGHADATVGGIAIQNFLIRKNLLTNLAIVAGIDDETFSNRLRIGVRDDWPAFRDLLQKASDSVDEKEIARLQERWLGSVSLDEKDAELTDEERFWIVEHPTIRIAATPDWPPFEFKSEDGAYTGISADMIRAAAKYVGLKPEIVFDKWDALLERMESKDLDVAPGLNRTPEREEYLVFTEPFVEQFSAIFVEEGTEGIRRIRDLYGKTVAVGKGYVLAEILRNEHPDIELLLVDNAIQALQAVSRKEADAYVGNQVVASFVIRNNKITNLKAAGVFGEQPGRLRFGVHKDRLVLRDILQKGLAALTKQGRNRIIAKYVDIEAGLKQRTVALTEDERTWLDQHREIRIGTGETWRPIEFFDEKGIYSGIASGFVRTVGGALGVKMTPVKELDWGTPLDRIGTGDLDILAVALPSAEGKKRVNFTKPYLSFPVVVVTRDDAPFISGLSDLWGKRVGAMVGRATVDRLRRNHGDVKLVPFTDYAEALNAVALGAVDGFVDNIGVVSYEIDVLGLSNLKVAAPTPYTDEIAMAVRKDWPQLLILLDKAIDSMSDAEKAAVKNEWIAIEYELGLDWWTVFMWAAPAGAGAILIIIVVVAWNRRLGGEIAERKRAETALAESEERTRLLLESVGEGVFGVDLEGTVTFVNPAALVMLGHDRDEMTGKDAHILIHHTRADGEHYPIEECPMWRAYTTGESTEADDEVLWRKDGTGFSARYNSTPIVRGGEIVGAVISFMDITERKKAEMALAESEERTRLLLESVGEGVFGVDLQGRVTFVNPPALAMLEFEHDDLIGNGAHALFHYCRADGSHYPVEECPMYRAFTFGEPSRIDDEVLWRKDGTSFPVEYNATPIMREGEKVGAVISFTDITERKQAEEKVRKILGDLNAVMEAIDYGILFMDSRLRAQVINRAFMEIWGIDRDLVAEGPTLADLMYHNQHKGLYDVDGGDFDWYVEERVSAVHKGSIPPTEIRRADGVHLRFQCIALPDGGRMMTYFDITEMKEKEAELARQKEIVDRTLGNLDQGIIMVDGSMSVVSRNARYAEMFSIPDAWLEPPAEYHQIIRRRLERGDFGQELHDGMIADTRRREFFSVERSLADGGVVEMRHIPLDDGGFVRSFTDITERKMAEEAIRLGGERLELALKGGDMGSWDIDLRKSTTVVNPRWWEMLGFAVDEVDNPRIIWRGTMHPDDRERVIEVGRAYRQGELPSYEVEYRVVTKQGETRWIVSKGATVGKGEDGSPLRMVGTVMDITERKESERQLTEAYEIITSSIQYASRIQRSILPPDSAVGAVFSDHFVLWEPRDVVGGDVYWCTTWGDGVLLILADCTGHGVPGAFMTLISTGALDRAQTEVPEGDVAALVQRMHQLVQIVLGQDAEQGESDDGLELGACYLIPGKATLEFVGARFSLFMAENGEVTELKGVKKGLGYRGVPLEQAYPGETVELRPGVGFYMTSDGLIDQIGGPKRRSFGKRRFRDLIVSVQELPLAEQRDRIVETLRTFQGDEERRDDVSVIGFTVI